MDGLVLTPITEALVIPVAFDWPSPDRIVEAIGTGAAKRAQRAIRAGNQVIGDRFKLEKDTQAQVLKRLAMLKDALAKRLLADGGAVTDFRQFNLAALSADVDRLTKDAQDALAKSAETDYKAADQLGVQAIQEPLGAAQLSITKALPGLDTSLVQAAFGNTVDLLTPPMQQYATQVKVALRGVALAGDNKFAAIAKLRDQIGGPNFQKAQYQAERIIRTELGRTFNTATYERLVALSKDFPFLRKGWRATNDRRTRQGHREAGQKYARGNGILVAEPFKLNVYDERPGKGAKLIGVATLQYPVDPNVKPEGRIGAAATIMCRCNGFVDMHLGDFAQFTRDKVATALSGVTPPATPEPPAKPKVVAGDDVSLAKSLKSSVNYYKGTYYGSEADMQVLASKLGRSGIRVVKGPAGRGFFYIEDEAGFRFGPEGWRTGKIEKPKPVKVAVPKPKDVKPIPSSPKGPQGPKVSAAADLTPANPGYKRKALNTANQAKLRKALDVIDSVHGDGNLTTIPVTQVPARYRKKAGAFYESSGDGRPMSLGFGGGLMGNSPYMTAFHEVGHWLDQQGVGARRYASTASFATEVAGGDQKVLDAVERWRQAVKNTQAIQTLEKWRGANVPADPRLKGYGGSTQGNGHTYGDGTVPLGVKREFVNYLLGAKEVWARSYAQYVAKTSGNTAALKELGNMQAASVSGLSPVARTTPYNGTPLGKAPTGSGWDYPWQWSDEDFAPVQAAFDNIMQVLGWRK